MTRAKRERIGRNPTETPADRIKRTTRMAFEQNNRGAVQLNVISEYPTPQETAKHAKEAIRLFKQICQEEELRLADKPF